MSIISKNELPQYYSALFEEAKYFERWYNAFHFSILISMVAAIFLKASSLYVAVVIALLAQIGLFVSRYFSNRSQSLAHELQRISMLNEAYSNEDYRFDISQIIGKISLRAHKIAKTKIEKDDDSTKYNPPPKAEKGASILRYLVQENSYWNHHLFDVCSGKSIKKFCFALGIVITAILLSIPYTTGLISDPDYSLLRIGLVFLSFLRIWEEIERAFRLRNASEIMLSIDNSLNSTESLNNESVMLIFSNYNIAKVTTPPLPDKVCNDHYEKLHDGWESRKKEILQD